AGILIYSMIAANSRGGLLSLAGLSVFAVVAHIFTRQSASSRRRGDGTFDSWIRSTFARKLAAGTVLGVLVFGTIVLMIAFVGGDAVVSRLEKLDREVGISEDNSRVNRNRIWHSTIDLIRARPVLGSGFGSYEVAITEFDTSSGKFVLKQAHNDYLEIAANGGFVSLIFFGVFAFLVIRRSLKNLGSRSRLRSACCFGALIGIFGVMIHNFVDFGLHLMVNALIFVVLIVIATADLRGSRNEEILEHGVT
ncbi:MAG: O-antigen ligase family protein, partial [Acidobacteriota bacterium]